MYIKLLSVCHIICVLTMFKLSSAFFSHTKLVKYSVIPRLNPLWSRRRKQKHIKFSTSSLLSSGSPVRVRFAPSPTGSLHIGGARTALFNWLFARKFKGKFIIRVEDTDESRSTRASEESIIRDLKWLGLDIDEGPGLLGGEKGPYRQSERKEIYQSFANQLIERGYAYHCFCTDEELQKKKDALAAIGKPNTYDGEWRDRNPTEVKEKLQRGTPYTVRFKVPNRTYFIDDIVRGRVVWNPSAALGDFIIMRSNGMPVYNFCVAIDDYLMNISHVIRAEEHLSNTIKQILIFEAVGAKHPQYAHCSIIQGSDKTKLSKRHGAASLSDYEAMGYIPSAMRNYLAMLGWNSGTNKEIFTDAELIEAFDPCRIIKSPAVFDTTRLNWVNTQHISRLPEEEYVRKCEEKLRKCGQFPLYPDVSAGRNVELISSLESEFVQIASKLAKRSLKLIDDVIPLTKRILCYPLDSIKDSERGVKALSDKNFIPVAQSLMRDFESGKFPQTIENRSYTPDDFSGYLSETANALGISKKDVFHPSRIALTGTLSGPDMGYQLRLIEITCELLKRLPSEVLQTLDINFLPLEKRMAELNAFVGHKVENTLF